MPHPPAGNRGAKTVTLNGEPLHDNLVPADRLEQDDPVGIVPGIGTRHERGGKRLSYGAGPER